MKRFGFTLLEVNLAMFVMAMGTLGLVSLYSYGHRENQQSNEDVQCAAVAEMNLNALVAALSSTNMSWSAWRGIELQPSNGWGEYAGDGSGATPQKNDGSGSIRIPGDPNTIAKGVFDRVMSAAGVSGVSMYDNNKAYKVAIVVSPGAGYRTYSVSVRCGWRAATLCYQPLYYSEVAFQGLRSETEGGGR